MMREATMTPVALLQICMDSLQGETGSCIETSLMCVDGTEEISIKVEGTIEIKKQIPEAIKFSPIKTEHEVRLCGVCNVLQNNASMLFMAPRKKL